MPHLTKRDLQMMNLVCQMETELVAEKINLTVNAINSRFAWIRRKRIECRDFENTLLGYERKCPDLRRRLTPTTKKSEMMR
jgi:hypothetical protein